jgi:hypothetical protein
MRLKTITIGCAVPRTDFSGQVHSVFQRACNVGLDNGRLIVLLACGLSDVPHGARLDTPPGFAFDALGLRPGQSFACNAGVAQFEGPALSVDLRTACVWDADLPETRVDISQPASHEAWQAAWDELGSDVEKPGFSEKPGFWVDSIAGLLAATRSLDAEGASAAAEALIGLGPGLTPSGDDFLVGYLTGLWRAAGPQPRAFASMLGAGIVRRAYRTNDISRAYLGHAAQGRASRVLIDLARAIDQAENVESVRQAARAALRVGSTSGVDGVLGLLLGLAVGNARFTADAAPAGNAPPPRPKSD